MVHHQLRTFFEAEISNRFSIQYFIGGGGGSSFYLKRTDFFPGWGKKSDKEKKRRGVKDITSEFEFGSANKLFKSERK